MKADFHIDDDGVLVGVSLNGNTTISLPSSPKAVKAIGSFVFTSDMPIEELTLNDECERICNKAFYYCGTLKKVTIGSGLKSIEPYAFAGRYSIEEWGGGSSKYSVKSGLLYDSTGKTVVLGVNKETVAFDRGTTSIGERAFSFCDKITILGLPETLTEVGEFAFSDCAGIGSVSIPAGVSEIGYGAFFGCTSLSEVILGGANGDVGGGVKRLDGLCFGWLPKLSMVILPSSVKEIGRVIGEESFLGCSKSLYFGLTDPADEYSSIIPQLPTRNFGEVSGVVPVRFHLGGNTYPEDMDLEVPVATPYSSLFSEAEITLGNPHVQILGWYYDDGTFEDQCLPTDVVKNYKIVNGEVVHIERIDVYAKYIADKFTITLDLCYDGKTVLIENQPYGEVINIKDFFNPTRVFYSFSGWYGTKTGEEYSDPLTDEDGNTEITVDGAATLYAKWESLSDVYEISVVGDASAHEVSIVGVLDWERVYSPGYIIDIPSKISGNEEDKTTGEIVSVDYVVVSVGSNVFRGVEDVKGVTFPASVKSIGARCFSGCVNLASITFADGSKCTTIGARAFEGTAITELVLPDSLTTIRQGAFVNCRSLETITFNSKIANIGTEAGNNRGTFEDCDSLTTVRIPSLSDWLKISFGNSACNPLSNGLTLYIEDESSESGYSPVTELSAENLGQITEIKDFAFTGCGGITSLNISGTDITRIGDEAFSANESLIAVTLGNTNLDTIGRAAFSNNSGLNSVIIPGTVKAVGGYAFNGCSQLSEVVIEDGCIVISASMFSYCQSLEFVEIPDSVKGIGASSFSSDVSLLIVCFKTSAGSQCNMIGPYAFSGCRNLYELCCLNGISIDDIKEDSEKRPAPSVPDALARIGEHAFDNCTNLEVDIVGDLAEHGEWIIRRW